MPGAHEIGGSNPPSPTTGLNRIWFKPEDHKLHPGFPNFWRITGIVDVAGGLTQWSEGPVAGLKEYFDMLVGIFKMAQEWKAMRMTFSSTSGV